MVTKLTAARIATQGGVDVLIANGYYPNVLLDAAKGTVRGTFFPAAGDRIESRKRWILGSISPGGHIVIDDGAVAALRQKGRSLLPAGVADASGEFARGESVEVRARDGSRVAAGVTNYASAELRQIRGLRSDRIVETLGYAYGDEVVHRDNLVLL
jgi:glutamate 5-kinase